MDKKALDVRMIRFVIVNNLLRSKVSGIVSRWEWDTSTMQDALLLCITPGP
jgi:hypothetical protein